MKDTKRTSFAEFEKWFSKTKQDWPLTPHDENDCGMAWKAALEWIYYEGILDPSLAGDLIEEELGDGNI